jgi:hypothetical protein
MSETKATGLIGVPAEAAAPVQHVTLEQLLEDEPLHSQKTILYLFSDPDRGYIAFPAEIHVNCEHEKCGGVRRHTKKDESERSIGSSVYAYVTYVCTNCTSRMKVFGLKAWWNGKKQHSGMCAKIYQEPPFGQPIPKRLFHVIGEANREYFLQARRAIARGLGIGAYGYYRRIIENTKFDLVGSVLEVAEATNASAAQIELLKKAQKEKQFSKTIDILRDVSAIPAALLIDGHNPLALLHDALSEGIHELSDAECLERAQDAEIILCEIANRMQIAVTEQKTVKAALASVLKRKSAGGKGPPNE